MSAPHTSKCCPERCIGTLYVVATPIGNRADMSERAREILASVERVAAEDTRHTGRLLREWQISTSLISIHEHNEAERVPLLLEWLRDGADVALVSDAGTPGISDPGYRLVVAAHAADVRVVPIPGPSAVVAALAAAGQPTDRFVFEGFLPARPGARYQRLQALAAEARTLVVYETGRRLVASLRDLVDLFGAERPVTLARELTKAHETIHKTDLGTLADWVAADADQRRGEIVLVIAGAPESASNRHTLTLAGVLEALQGELPPARAAAVAARLTGVKRREAYRAAIAHSNADGDDA